MEDCSCMMAGLENSLLSTHIVLSVVATDCGSETATAVLFVLLLFEHFFTWLINIVNMIMPFSLISIIISFPMERKNKAAEYSGAVL